MKVLAKNGLELATVDLQTRKGEPVSAHACVPAAKFSGDAKIRLDYASDQLVAHVTMNGWACDAVLTVDDIADARGAISGNLIRLLLKGMVKKKPKP